MIPATDALYQACYCEENVYKLIEKMANPTDFYAVFISNDCQMVPLWRQKAGDSSGFVVWDYHVVAIKKKKTYVRVYDLDSTLPWGTDFSTYWTETMKESTHYLATFKRKFRVIPGNIYLSLLSSDRSHMKSPTGEYLKTPPSWPLINPQIPSNLMQLVKMSENVEETEIMDEHEMTEFFTAATRRREKSMNYIDPNSSLTLAAIETLDRRKREELDALRSRRGLAENSNEQNEIEGIGEEEEEN